MHVVVCGGGAIGACTAYFLSRRGIDVTVVERSGIACAASGKAGGFLALDWCAGSPLDELARRSFALHASLAEETGNSWGHRPMTAYAGFVVPEGRHGGGTTLDWLSERVAITQRLGTPKTTAIVHPGQFTQGIMGAAQRNGARVRAGRVTGLVGDGTAVRGVEVDDARIEADAVVITMGPWSLLAAQWLRLPPVFARTSPSLVFDTGTDVPADALFIDCQDEDGAVVSVEVFPRANGNTHVTAFSNEDPLPLDPAAVTPDDTVLERLHAICRRISPAFDRAKVIARQACARPMTQDFLPLMGRVPGAEGAYIATGHNVWGILNAPASGEAMAELIADGAARTVDLAPFAPGRLRPLDPARLNIG
jgi:glycine/D-amino acid oxidase-like deaminating enzyme